MGRKKGSKNKAPAAPAPEAQAPEATAQVQAPAAPAQAPEATAQATTGTRGRGTRDARGAKQLTERQRELAAKILSEQRSLEMSVRDTLERARRQGEWLAELKADVEKSGWGQWGEFLRTAEIPFSRRLADYRISIFEGWSKIENFMKDNPDKKGQLTISWARKFVAPAPGSRRDRNRSKAWMKNFKSEKLEKLMSKHGIAVDMKEVLKFLLEVGTSERAIKDLAK